MKLSVDLREFIELLNSNRVEFIVVGAHALAWHGLPRYTKDIDLLVRAAPANADALVAVLDAFGFGSLGIGPADFLIPDRVIQLGRDPHRIDLLTAISGVTWDEAWSSRVEAQLDGIPVSFLGHEAFIRNKLAAGRPQDLADVSRLRQISGE